MSSNEPYSNIRENKPLTALFLLFFGLVIAVLFLIFRPYFYSFLFAIILYFPLRVVYKKITGVFKRKALSAGLVILMLVVIIVIPASLVMSSLANQTFTLYNMLQGKINADLLNAVQNNENLRGALEFLNIEESKLMERAAHNARQYLFGFFKNVTSIISFQVNLIVNFLCMMLMLFFLLKDGDSLGPMIYRALPFPNELEQDVSKRLQKVINVLITGNLFIMGLQGFMLGIGLYIAGFSAPLLWGVIGSVFALIPLIGTSVIWLPAVIYLIVIKSYFWAALVGVWSLLWYLILENLLKPLIFGGTLSFHPLLFFFLLLGSIQTFGMAGIIIGPIILTLFVSLWEIYKMLDLYAPKTEAVNRGVLENNNPESSV